MSVSYSVPRLCGLLADSPSRLSQAMHNAGYRALGLEYVYAAFDTVNTAFGLQAMRELGIRGLSLTIPHKEAALAFVDEISVEVQAIGAINTVVNEDGQLRGENTDWYGVAAALEEAGFTCGKDTHALVFGSGGAARAALYALTRAGAGKVSVSGRNAAAVARLAGEFKVHARQPDGLDERFFASTSLFINATPIGLAIAGEGASYPFSLELIGSTPVVFEMVTKQTPLTAAARAAGCRVIAGARMLLHQAARQFELFTGEPAPLAAMEEALQRELA